MIKKYRKSTIRIICLVISFCLIFSTVGVSFVLADDELMDDMIVNGLDYVYGKESEYASDFAYIGFGFTAPLSAIYIDALVRVSNDGSISSVYVSDFVNDSYLNCQIAYQTVEDGSFVSFYHVYGSLSLDATAEGLVFSFYGSFPFSDCIDFLSLSFCNGSVQRLTETTQFRLDFYNTTKTANQTGSTYAGWTVEPTSGGAYPYILSTTASKVIWSEYDYAEFVYRVGALSVSSVSAFVGDVAVPCYAYNITGSSYTENTDFVFRVVVDLRGVKNESGDLSVSVRGNAARHAGSWFYQLSNNFLLLTVPQDPVVSYFGYFLQELRYEFSGLINSLNALSDSVRSGFSSIRDRLDLQVDGFADLASILTSIDSTLTSFFESFGDGFKQYLYDLWLGICTYIKQQVDRVIDTVSTYYNSLFEKLDNHFDRVVDTLLESLGVKDTSGAAASQTQAEVNTSINNQVVGAVQDWDTHIQSVQVGYDAAFLKAGPALAWMGSLADGIFSNMGWFSNVYFLVGMMSVFMLILSKSGIAHKVGSVFRSSGSRSNTSGKGPG